MAEVKVLIATLENLKDIQNLNLLLFKKESSEFDSTLNYSWPFSKDGKKYFKEKIKGKNGCAFLALCDGKIVGYLVGGMNKSENYRNISKMAELENMFVLEEYRNSKIGAKLVQEFLNWCREKKINRMRVVISAQNIKAINFYKKFGFKDYALTLER